MFMGLSECKNCSGNFSKGRYDLILTFDLEGNILVKEYQVDVSDSGQIVNLKEIVYDE